MNKFLLAKALKELKNRQPQEALDLSKICFPEQLAFIKDTSKTKAACLPRRAGKTTTCAYDLISKAITKPNVVCLYITLSRANAKRIIWPMLLQINRELNLKGVPNEADLCLVFPNSSRIYCSGAKDASEIEKFRGLALFLVYIDEAQAFRSHIKELIDDVLSPALRDYNGQSAFIGTPGPMPVGTFYELLHNPTVSTHLWTGSANPHLFIKSGQTFEEQLAAELLRMNCSVDHPTIKREWFGEWVLDTDKQVFKYSVANHYHSLPTLGKWNYIIGVDLGYEDADAIAVLGWQQDSRTVYLIEEVLKRKQGITPLAETLIALRNRYKPLKIVMDAGGLGKKIQEEISARFLLDIQAAEKTRKFEFIELLNDALRRNELLAKTTSHFAKDSGLVEWEIPHVKLKDQYHSDICDSVLYAYRECMHWLETIPLPAPTKDQIMLQEEERMIDEAIKQTTREDEEHYDDDYYNVY